MFAWETISGVIYEYDCILLHPPPPAPAPPHPRTRHRRKVFVIYVVCGFTVERRVSVLYRIDVQIQKYCTERRLDITALVDWA